MELYFLLNPLQVIMLKAHMLVKWNSACIFFEWRKKLGNWNKRLDWGLIRN